MSIDLPTPEGSARKAVADTQADGSVDREDKAAQGDNAADSGPSPQSCKDSSKEDQPAKQGTGNNPNLQREDLIPEGPGAAMNRTERFALWTLVATAFLAAATLALAVATADMARSTRGLKDFAEQQAHDMQAALKISDRQARASEIANDTSARSLTITVENFSRQTRPFVLYTPVRYNPIEGGRLKPSGNAVCGYENTGIGTALGVTQFGISSFIPKELDSDDMVGTYKKHELIDKTHWLDKMPPSTGQPLAGR